MRILYGVQGTGQGHISRARAMARAFSAHPDVKITWLFSGRDRDRFFDMEVFGHYLWRRGLSFSTGSGKLSKVDTLLSNRFLRFASDVRSLDVSDYDLVVSDFEPVTAWAARFAGKKSVGIGHQYAFGRGTPREGDSWASDLIMRKFAPVDVSVGLHWLPYHDCIAPPILDLPIQPVTRDPYTLVYLPFEDQPFITDLLMRFPRYHFVQYAPGLSPGSSGNVRRFPASVQGFKRHLLRAGGVICNSGFELISECLQLNKPVLTKPLEGQFEQLSNARALRDAGFATTSPLLDEAVLARWLESPRSPGGQSYPDVAAALAAWLAGGRLEGVEALCRGLWSRRTAMRLPTSQGPRGVQALKPEMALADRGHSRGLPI